MIASLYHSRSSDVGGSVTLPPRSTAVVDRRWPDRKGGMGCAACSFRVRVRPLPNLSSLRCAQLNWLDGEYSEGRLRRKLQAPPAFAPRLTAIVAQVVKLRS